MHLQRKTDKGAARARENNLHGPGKWPGVCLRRACGCTATLLFLLSAFSGHTGKRPPPSGGSSGVNPDPVGRVDSSAPLQ